MSSTLQSALTYLQWNDYVSLAMITAVVYDYILLFPTEITYIWSKQWTWVSTLFILVRYCGLLTAICNSFVGTTFLPGPTEVLAFMVNCIFKYNSCGVLYIVQLWSLFLFLGAADFIMILRVWAMYNQSRLILGILLLLFFTEVVSTIIYGVTVSIPKDLIWSISQTLEYSYCTSSPAIFTETVSAQISYAAQILVGIMLCMLAIIQFVRQSLQMYRVTRQWQLNQYINILVRQGLAYFFVILLLNVINEWAFWGAVLPSYSGPTWLLILVQFVPTLTLTPRFIISIREMHEHDVHRGRGNGIDSGFGLSTLSDRRAVTSRIVFPSRDANEVVDNTEAAQNTEAMENIETDGGQDEGTESMRMVPILDVDSIEE